MVPLPNASKGLPVEILAALIGCLSLTGISCASWNIRFHPSTRCTTKITLQTEHGPAVFPSDRSEGDRAANGVEVHHEQRPPLSALILDDTALMDVGAGRFVLIHLGNAELRAVMSDAVLLAPRHLSQ